MRIALVGDGPRAREVLAALQAHTGVTVGAQVSRHSSLGVPAFPTLQAALGPVSPDLVVLTGDFQAADVLSAARSHCAVLVVEAGNISQEAVSALRQLGADENARVFLAPGSDYPAGRTVRRYLNAGRVGPIGHLSCVDYRAGAVGAGEGARHWLSRGGLMLARICALLDTSARNVIARIDDQRGVTEAYLETVRGVHVHYSAGWQAAVESHCLWIEGVKSSLRTDGGRVWWRKRGWHVFVPVRIGLTPRALPLRGTIGRVVAEVGRVGDRVDDRQALCIAAAALASAASRQVASLAVASEIRSD